MIHTPYAAAASSQPVNLIDAENTPAEKVRVIRSAEAITDVRPSDYESVDPVHARFSRQGRDLENLDTSADLDAYIVDPANGHTVRYHHQEVATTRPPNLEKEGKSLKERLENVERTLHTQQKVLLEWQVATNLIEAFSTKLWRELSYDQKRTLEDAGIDDIPSLQRRSRKWHEEKTGRNEDAYTVFQSISKERRGMLRELQNAKDRLSQRRADYAHPPVYISQLREFVGTALDPSKIIMSEIEALETLEVWGDDEASRLFLDDE